MTLNSATGDAPSTDTVTAAFGGPVVRVTLDRPAQRNPLDRATVARLAGIVDAVDADPVARVAVIRGAGGDLKGYVDLYRRPDDFRRFLEDFHGLLSRMEASRRIWIAVIDGYCVASG
jgi:enoyl-CoA hydratase